jgi:plastocyanin
MRKLLALLALAGLMTALAVAFAATAAAEDAPVRAAKTRTVRVADNFFKAKTIKVRKGTIVRWVWGADGEPTAVEHDVYSTKGTRLRSGFKTEGTYRKRIRKTTRYLCRVHATTMRGKIVVTNP